MNSITDPASFVRPSLRALEAYHLDLSTCPHKLDQNEVPFDLPRWVKERIAARWLKRDWARYPDFHGDDLRAALSRHHDWPAPGVLVGNGSNELLGVLLEALGGTGGAVGEVLLHSPSFGLYPMFVLRGGARPRIIGAGRDLRLPLEAIEEEIGRDPGRPLVLCSPNNPVGDAATPAEVARLLERLEAPLLLDNAYGEFCRHDYRPLLHDHRNLVILRTFSKAWSLAGQRLGYLLADPALVTELIKVKLPYNVSHASAVAGEEALRAHQASQRRVNTLIARRPQWAAVLGAAGFEVFPSEANFLLVRHPRGRAVADGLARQGVRVRDVGGYMGMAGCLRVSIGRGKDLRALRDALASPALVGISRTVE